MVTKTMDLTGDAFFFSTVSCCYTSGTFLISAETTHAFSPQKLYCKTISVINPHTPYLAETLAMSGITIWSFFSCGLCSVPQVSLQKSFKLFTTLSLSFKCFLTHFSEFLPFVTLFEPVFLLPVVGWVLYGSFAFAEGPSLSLVSSKLFTNIPSEGFVSAYFSQS